MLVIIVLYWFFSVVFGLAIVIEKTDDALDKFPDSYNVTAKIILTILTLLLAWLFIPIIWIYKMVVDAGKAKTALKMLLRNGLDD